MKLIPISEHPEAAKILYDLLAERPLDASISHKKIPTWEEHCRFVSRALGTVYHAWYLIAADDQIVGSVYLTDRDEIGVSIFHDFQRRRFGTDAVREIMRIYGPSREGRFKFLANVSPANEPSRRMFETLGFKHVQNTFALEAE